MTYKIRAECMHDLLQLNELLFLLVFIYKHEKIHPDLPDVEAEFESSMTTDELREAIAIIPDSHVMAETLAPLEQYTGQRQIINPKS